MNPQLCEVVIQVVPSGQGTQGFLLKQKPLNLRCSLADSWDALREYFLSSQCKVSGCGVCVCVCLGLEPRAHIWRLEEDDLQGSVLSFHHLGFRESKLRSSSLVASAFTHRLVSVAPVMSCKQMDLCQQTAYHGPLCVEGPHRRPAGQHCRGLADSEVRHSVPSAGS